MQIFQLITTEVSTHAPRGLLILILIGAHPPTWTEKMRLCECLGAVVLRTGRRGARKSQERRVKGTVITTQALSPNRSLRKLDNIIIKPKDSVRNSIINAELNYGFHSIQLYPVGMYQASELCGHFQTCCLGRMWCLH